MTLEKFWISTTQIIKGCWVHACYIQLVFNTTAQNRFFVHKGNVELCFEYIHRSSKTYVRVTSRRSEEVLWWWSERPARGIRRPKKGESSAIYDGACLCKTLSVRNLILKWSSCPMEASEDHAWSWKCCHASVLNSLWFQDVICRQAVGEWHWSKHAKGDVTSACTNFRNCLFTFKDDS